MFNDIISENNIEEQIHVTAEEKYLMEFPKRDRQDLRYEVGKIAELLVENQESNRYTDLLRKKVNKNRAIYEIRNSKNTEIDILTYDNKKMKAKVTYKDLSKEYSLVLDMNTVSQGRLFVRDFDIRKENRKINLHKVDKNS